MAHVIFVAVLGIYAQHGHHKHKMTLTINFFEFENLLLKRQFGDVVSPLDIDVTDDDR